MYLVSQDVKDLCSMLDDDPDVALIRPAGPKRWKAHRDVPALGDGDFAFWHIPSGPIELVTREPTGKGAKAKDPFKGWTEIAPPVQKGVPWFGPTDVGVIWLRIRQVAGPAHETYQPTTLAPPWSAPKSEVIGRSEFYWVGNYFSVAGAPAPDVTKRWWSTLRRRVAKIARQIPCSGPLTGSDKDVWAFPAALVQIRKGKKRADNPA